MRILAIRGRNLASLAGDFEVRLDEPPLAGAGLFAITGRTGAGKSTILDALCLALYDRVPRLPGGRGVEVGRADEAADARLKNNDVRSLLRRGAGEGHAEVDFLASDRRRYRARWSVRRARGRADGRFQNQTLELQDLESGESLSGTKTEVLERIHARLGLSFDQFRRSVLLAQGDFAAFLRADAGERAELLERITGTEIYRDLSIAAHRRAADERKALELIDQRWGDQAPLPEDERKALDGALAAARALLDQRLAAQRRLQDTERWYQVVEKLAAEHAEALARRAEADAALGAAEPRRRLWERVCRLEPLRQPIALFDQTVAGHAEAERALAAALADEPRLSAAAAAAAAAVQSADSAFQHAQAVLRDAGPALKEARRLDTRLDEARGQQGRLDAERAAAELVRVEAAAGLAALEGQATAAAAALQAAEEWLAAHAGSEPLAAQWERWEGELRRFAAALTLRARAVEDAAAAAGKREGLSRRRGELEATLSADRTARDGLAAERDALQERAAAYDPEALAARREEIQGRRQRLSQWRRLIDQALEVRERLTRCRKALTAEDARTAACEARLTGLDSELAPAAAALAEADAARQRLLLAGAGDVAALRHQLVDGEPCPVCGSEAHPWADRSAALIQDLAREQAERVAALKERLEARQVEAARCRAEADQARRRAVELADDAARDQVLLERLLGDWTAWEPDPLRPDDPFADGLPGRIEAEDAEVAGALARVTGDEAQARALAGEIQRRSKGIETHDAHIERGRAALEALDGTLRDAVQAGERADSEGERAFLTLEEAAVALAAPLAAIEGWRRRLESGPDEFTAGCRREVLALRDAEHRRSAAAEQGQTLAPKVAEAVARRRGADERLDQCSRALAGQGAAVRTLERERNGWLDGRPADALEAALTAAVGEAAAGLETARRAEATAREALTSAQGVIRTRRSRVAECETALAEARTALDARMAERAVGLEELRAVLARGHDWIEQERTALAALADACERARELALERERRLAEHRAAEAPAEAREAVAAGLAQLAESLAAAQDQWGGLHGRAREDDRRREAALTLGAERERQQAVWAIWEALRELIGSSDGSKFRNFAQGLTLDLLVDHANVHLRDLARRYELQRVPGAEMELQVIDREMGDEVRSVHSLSGGESFLASLALALGLASLASDRVQVDSLFIDEGFGALDPDSLDLAIASLDALYSLGRQVGVISHVPTLVERIGVRVQIIAEGGGRSRVAVVTG